MERLRRYVLYATVCITGAAVLIIEVAAVRMLSPFFGSSLFVLSSVLTVILAALSFGYFIGGKLSDRFPAHPPLYALIALSGIVTLLAQLGAMRLLPEFSDSFSIIRGPLYFSLLFFFIPAFFLGIVSPYVIKLQSLCTSHERMGSVVGTTFFWGTIGSIAGSLTTGFFLLPLFGAQQSIVGTGLMLVALGIVGVLALSGMTHQDPLSAVLLHAKFIVLFGILALMLLALIDFASVRPGKNVLYEADGLYSHILVYEAQHPKGRMRVLERDRNYSSAILLDSHDLVFGYTQFAELYPVLKEETDSFLLIGGGAYSIPRTLVARDDAVAVDVVEIEPSLFEIAAEYFDLIDTERINNFVMDGRVFLARGGKEYDVIFGDAFGTDLGVPAHLTTKEFLEEVRASLTDDGIYMLNYIGALQGDAPTLTGSMVKTLQSVFPNFKMYAFNKPDPQSTQNIVFVARNGDAPIDLSGRTIYSTGGNLLLIPALEVPVSKFNLEQELVLTDDRAPVEYLMAKQL